MTVIIDDTPSDPHRCENNCQRKGCYFHPDLGTKEQGLDIDHVISIPEFIRRFGCGHYISETPTYQKQKLNCFGENCRSVSDPNLCEKCKDLEECKKLFYHGATEQKGPYVITEEELIAIENLIECDRACSIADIIDRDPYSRPLSEEIRKEMVSERKRVILALTDETKIHNLRIKDGEFEMASEGIIGHQLIRMITDFYESNGGDNYFTMTVAGMVRDKHRKYELTICRSDGKKTPADTIAELKEMIQNAQGEVLDKVLQLINANCYELEGKQLKITPLLLCQKIESMRGKKL